MIAWATRGDLERVKALLDDGAEVDAEDPANEATAAFYAAARGHLQVTRLLVEKGADLKVRARNGATALIDAIQVFHDNPEQWHKGTTLIEVVNYLLASGIDRDARDDDGATALDYAQRFKYLDVAAALRSTK
jgi:ankyrin repeat protein